MSGSTGATAGADRTDDRRRDLRKAISAAAVDLVIERGLDAVTVDEIARAANVSRRTFFNYFPSKAAACIPATPPAGREAVKEFLSDHSVSTMTALARLMWHQVSHARRQSRAFDRFHDMWRREPSVRTEVHEILSATEKELALLVALREGRSPDSVQAATVAAASIAILRIAVERWRTDEPGSLLEYRIKESFDAVRESVAEPRYNA